MYIILNLTNQPPIKDEYYLRGTMSTFLFLSLLSALCPAAQSPIVKRGV